MLLISTLTNKRNLAVGAVALVLAIAAVLYFQNSSRASTAKGTTDLDYNSYAAFVTAFTSGYISSEGVIEVRFARSVADSSMIDQEAEANLFSFKPAIKGTAYWNSDRRLEFRPEKRLPSGQHYDAQINLGKLFDEAPKDLSKMEFSFATITQTMDVELQGLSSVDNKKPELQALEGKVVLADVADAAAVQKTLTATQEGKDLTIEWDANESGTEFRFTIRGVTRANTQESKVNVAWNSKGLGMTVNGGRNVRVAPLNEFSISKVKVVQQPEQYVSILFTDPIKPNQNLNGLIRLSNRTSMRYVVTGNEIRAYPSVAQKGKTNLRISAGIRNSKNYQLDQGLTENITFEQEKPNVRLVGSGNIVPGSNGLILPFEAVNLKAVDVSVIRIFEDNIPQFLQENSISSNYRLRYVGLPIKRKRINLQGAGVADLGQWNRFTLDLNELFQQEPGAMYRVEIKFKQAYSVYACGEEESVSEATGSTTGNNNALGEEEERFDSWEGYEEPYRYIPDYWSNRDNPCHPAYYREKEVARNIMASNLGIIAKKGRDKSMLVTVTDMRTAQPLANTTVQVLNLQQQVLASATTNAEGMVTFEDLGYPYMLKASNGNERGYMRLVDGESLNLSNFDIAGQRVQKGIKGLIYGERGVWRPGDSLYLSFMLEDKQKTLPESHPVVMEITDPRGQVVQRMVRSTGVNGLYKFATKTSTNAPTGSYTAKVTVGGSTFYKNLPIETVKPNRLKVLLDFGKEALTPQDKSLNGNLQVNWLHGAPGRNLKAEFDVALQSVKTSFERFPDYIFDDPTSSYDGYPRRIFEGTTNELGQVQVSGTLPNVNKAPGKLVARFSGKVYEPGGDFSVSRQSIPYYPYDHFVGVRTPEGDRYGRLQTDKQHTVDIVTLDPEGNPVASNNIKVTLYKVSWRWWWDNSSNQVSNFLSSRYTQRISSGRVSTGSNGKAQWSFKVEYPSWGRYLVYVEDPNSGHKTGKTIYVDWPGWAGRGKRENPGGATMLMFGTDKESYDVGQTAKVTLPGAKDSRALISIENGTRVLSAFWQDTQEGETQVSIPITEDMAPNVYVHVTLLQPHAQTANDMPIRMYGVVPMLVNNPNTLLEPVIEMASELKPEEEVTIKVSEADGKDMAYTVAVVDEGLLDLTNFKTPAPWATFYAREALGVSTFDIYEDVMGAFGGQLERLLAIGGGAYDEEDDEKKQAQRFKPVVKFMGPFYLKGGRTAEHSFVMPNYVGSVRTMVVAGYEGAYGHTETTTPVRKALMVLGTLPRVLGPGETVKLPVNVFAMKEKVKNVKVNVKTNNLLQVQGGNVKNISFSKPGDDVVTFDLQVGNEMGVGQVDIEVSSAGETARYSIEIQVRTPNPEVTKVAGGLLPANGTYTNTINTFGVKGTNKVTIEVSSLPPLNMGKRLSYLIRYPHGCIEQTTSSVFPQLFLSSIKELNSNDEERIRKNVNAGIERLKLFQTNDGGFSYWPGGNEESHWGTNYGGHFLLEAEKLGYAVPKSMKRNWLKYQRKEARNYNNSTQGYEQLNQAYRLYSLAMAGKPEMGAMNRMAESESITTAARWRLAAAYAMAGYNDVAQKLTNGLTTQVAAYVELSYTYGSGLRDEAMILETLGIMNKQAEGFPVLRGIATQLGEDRWYSTQTTAYCLLAIAKFANLLGKDKGIDINYNYKGKDTRAATDLMLVQKELPVQGAETQNISFKNNGNNPLFVRIITQGSPLEYKEPAVANNLNMDIAYLDNDGNPIDVSRLTQGTSFMARVTVKHPGTTNRYYREMALSQNFPSGWEITNTRLDQAYSSGDRSSSFDYQDIRDDRVYTYFSLAASSSKTFYIRLNATYAGRYYLPGVEAGAMYDNAISNYQPGRWIEVSQE